MMVRMRIRLLSAVIVLFVVLAVALPAQDSLRIATLTGRLYEQQDARIVEKYVGEDVSLSSTITVTGTGVLEYGDIQVTLSRNGTYRVDELVEQSKANAVAEIGRWQSVARLADRIGTFLDNLSDDNAGASEDPVLAETSPSLAERYQAAAAAALAGDHQRALAILASQRPDQAEPIFADYLLLQASVAIGLYDHSAALATLRELIADFSLEPGQEQQLRLLQGLAFYGLGNYGSARQYFRLVVGLDPTSAAGQRAQALLDELVASSSR